MAREEASNNSSMPTLTANLEDKVDRLRPLIPKIGSSPDDTEGDGKLLLLIAHADDEAMFFSPYLCWAKERNKEVVVLCLSWTEIRKAELIKSCTEVYKIDENNIYFPAGGRFLDTMDPKFGKWSSKDVVEEANKVIKKTSCDCILTFDNGGVSGHPNHISLSDALVSEEALILSETVQFWTLVSYNFFLKYIMGYFVYMYLSMYHRDQPDSAKLHECFRSHPYLEEIIVERPSRGQMKAGMRCHASQLVWYRWIWIWLSVYNCSNELVRIYPQQSNEDKKTQ